MSTKFGLTVEQCQSLDNWVIPQFFKLTWAHEIHFESAWDIDDDALTEIDKLVPPGEHTGWGFNDPITPVLGRPKG